MRTKTIKVALVVGARPNFIKISPIIRAIKNHNKRRRSNRPSIDYNLVHTGQHYDECMSDHFFDDLKIPLPHINLDVGSSSHSKQTAQIMMRFEEVIVRDKPDLIVVVGDVNSTMAVSIVASKLMIPVAHVEAGLRSFDRSMPEEVNRVVTDALSDLLFITCTDAKENLLKEGKREEGIFFVGNVMIDSLKIFGPIINRSNILKEMGLKPNSYIILTLHRPSNVDQKDILKRLLDALLRISRKIPIIFPIHPRTERMLRDFRLQGKLEHQDGIILRPPMRYVDFMKLMSHSKLVFTDSGGIQEETTVYRVPCLTLRENTERPITVKEGTNILIGFDMKRLEEETDNVLQGKGKRGKIPKMWDGKASERIVNIISDYFCS